MHPERTIKWSGEGADDERNVESRLDFVCLSLFYSVLRTEHFDAIDINEWDLPPLGMHKRVCSRI